jgi:hypothetical protein
MPRMTNQEAGDPVSVVAPPKPLVIGAVLVVVVAPKLKGGTPACPVVAPPKVKGSTALAQPEVVGAAWPKVNGGTVLVGAG